MPFLRNRIGRAALTIALLLSTQLAMAGQFCHSAMTVVPNGCPMDVRGVATHDMAVVDSYSCCDGDAMPASPCVTALGDLSLAAIASGSAPLLDLAPPIRVGSMAVVVGAPSLSAPLPTASVGPPLRSYIVFRRFLS
jgi:hypothetical protein